MVWLQHVFWERRCVGFAYRSTRLLEVTTKVTSLVATSLIVVEWST